MKKEARVRINELKAKVFDIMVEEEAMQKKFLELEKEKVELNKQMAEIAASKEAQDANRSV